MESRMCQFSWFLDPGGWSKTATVGLYFIFPGICTLSLASLYSEFQDGQGTVKLSKPKPNSSTTTSRRSFNFLLSESKTGETTGTQSGSRDSGESKTTTGERKKKRLPTAPCEEYRSQGGAAAEMNMRGMAIAVAVIVCAATVQGFSMFKRARCLCIESRTKAVRMADVETVSIIYPSNGCDRVEVIITLKAHKRQTCLDPESKQARLIRQFSLQDRTAVHCFVNPPCAIIYPVGIPLSRTVRCFCINIDDRPVKPRTLGKLEIIPASQSCPRIEIIVTMKKTEEKRCLNPESEAIKSLLKIVSKKSDSKEICSAMKSTVLLLLGILFLDQCGVQGALVIRNQRCSCISTRQGMIHYRSLVDIKQFAPSPNCNKTEIIWLIFSIADLVLTGDPRSLMSSRWLFRGHADTEAAASHKP
ncbi:hypothetical protein STEG23_036120 [Scotinomys teguina]